MCLALKFTIVCLSTCSGPCVLQALLYFCVGIWGNMMHCPSVGLVILVALTCVKFIWSKDASSQTCQSEVRTCLAAGKQRTRCVCVWWKWWKHVRHLCSFLLGSPATLLQSQTPCDACEGNVSDMLFSCLQNFLVKPHMRLIAHRYLLFDQSQTDQHGGRTGVTSLWRRVRQPCSTCAEEGAQKAAQKSMVAATCLRKVWLWRHCCWCLF